MLANIAILLWQTLVQWTSRRLTFNLPRTVSYGNYCTHIVIYIPVFAINENTALSLGVCEDSELIGCFMTYMLRVV